MILGLFIGESFAELSLVRSAEKLADPSALHPVLDFKRWNFSKQSLKSFLSAWSTQLHAEKPDWKPQQVIVSSRFLYRLVGHRMGGSVAQLVTQGLENWAQIYNPQTAWNLSNPARTPTLGSLDLIFPVSEKIDSHGHVQIPLQLEALQAIHEKLKQQDIKKICIHLSQAQKNSVHHDQAAHFFDELGYQVYRPQLNDRDLFENWRTNILNASISSTFEETFEEIKSGLETLLPPEKIYFFTGDLEIHQGQPEHRLSNLFAMESCLKNQLTKIHKIKSPWTLLHLGLEQFSLIQDPGQITDSPWGLLNLKSTRSRDLNLQPTTFVEFKNNHLQFLDEQSFEPGPIRLGRGVKPLLSDFLLSSENIQNLVGLDEKQSKQAHDRWQLTLQTWQRTSKNAKPSLSFKSSDRTLERSAEKTTDQWQKELQKEILDQILRQTITHSEFPVKVFGYYQDLISSPWEKLKKLEKSTLLAYEMIDKKL